MSTDQYVLTLCPTAGGDLDLSSLRGCAIADARARFARMGVGEQPFVRGGGAASGGERLAALAVGGTAAAPDDAAVQRWAQWLIERLEAADLIYHRTGEGWRLRTGKLHTESEQRLGELTGWSPAALAGQRKLLEHVDDPGDSGSELEQSLSKLAAAGWKVDAKKDKGPPTVHFAAGDMPLARGEDWRADGAVDPRLAAALAALIAAVPPAQRESLQPEDVAEDLARRLPALTIAAPGCDLALLDIRTIAKALRDAGGLDLPTGEPLGPVLTTGKLALRAVKRSAKDAGPAPEGVSRNGATPDAHRSDPSAPAAGHAADPNDPGALIAANGADALRFALLHAAAPEKPFRGGEDVVGYAAGFLARLSELAAARLDGATTGTRIDGEDELRRRLAGWCDTALARIAENYERLDMHRATRNAITLLARIEDFEARVAEQRGEVAGADRDAVSVALALLAQLLAPLAPTAAGDVWRRAGRDGLLDEARWPSAQREPAAA